jgi:hypothetical protein
MYFPHLSGWGQSNATQGLVKNKYEQPYGGPHSILQVNTNGAVHLQMGAISNTIKICWIDPYKDPDSIHGGECNMHQSRRNRFQL